METFFGKVIVLVTEALAITKITPDNCTCIFPTDSFKFVDTGYIDSSTEGKDAFFNRQLDAMENKVDKYGNPEPRSKDATPLLLNWTLTQSTITAILSTITRLESIKDLSLDEHAYLVSHFEERVKNLDFKQYANIIPVDFCDTNVLNTVLWLLEKRFN